MLGVRSWCEAGLGICLLLLMPMLALLPHGVAPLAAAAALCAGAIVALNRPVPLGTLRAPAALLVVLLLWAGVSALWSIAPGRSLVLETRLVGLALAAVALAAAAAHIAAPARLARLMLSGTALGIALGLADLATHGGLHSRLSVREFQPYHLNQIAVALAILGLPLAAWLIGSGRRVLGVAAAAVMAETVLVLAGTSAKIALVAGVAGTALVWLRRGVVTRAAALLCVLAILLAPLVLPKLERLPGLLVAAEQLKMSASHRLMIWAFVGERIAERPLLGWGLDAARAIPGGKAEIRPGETQLPLHPHNAALQVWLELGLPGAALFAGLIAWLWLRIASAPWGRLYSAAAAGALTAALCIASASYGIWQEWWLATLAFALFAVLAIAPPQCHRYGHKNRRGP